MWKGELVFSMSFQMKILIFGVSEMRHEVFYELGNDFSDGDLDIWCLKAQERRIITAWQPISHHLRAANC